VAQQALVFLFLVLTQVWQRYKLRTQLVNLVMDT